MKKLLALLLAMGLTIGACTSAVTPQNPSRQERIEAATAIVLTLATSRFFQAYPQYAAPTQMISAGLIELIETGQIESLDYLQDKVAEKINWERLTPAEVVAVRELVSLIRLEIDSQLGIVTPQDKFTAESKEKVIRILVAINLAATL